VDVIVREPICSQTRTEKLIKGKERKSIYIAPFCIKVRTKRSGMDHTVLPANNTITGSIQ